MNVVADESVDRAIVERLRQDGHAVLYVAESAPSIGDDAVLRRAKETDALLLTADKDFGEISFRLGRIHTGVVLLRLSGLSVQLKVRTVSTVFADRGYELASAFSVISPGRVRIRHRTTEPQRNN